MRCANPECRTESKYLRSASLYWIHERSSGGEVAKGRFIWLCSMCAAEYVVETWRPAGQQLRRRRSVEGCPPAKAPHSGPKDNLVEGLGRREQA